MSTDKSYQMTPIGSEVARYLRTKRMRLTDSSYRSYEECLETLWGAAAPRKQGVVGLTVPRCCRDTGLHREEEPEPLEHWLDEPLLRLTLVGVLETGPLGLP